MQTFIFNLKGVIFPAMALQKALQSLLGVRKSQGSEDGRGMGPTGPRMGRALNHKHAIALIK